MAGHFRAPANQGPTNQAPARVRYRPWIFAGATAAILALAATLAVIWPGYDARQTPHESAAVWALQTGEGKRYARVNTQLGELDTIKEVENPSGIAQTADRLFVFADGNQRFANINPALPVDLADDSAEVFESTPADTTTVLTSGDSVAYLTASGEVYTAKLSNGGATIPIDPYADVEVDEGEERPKFRATAIALGLHGEVAAYSPSEERIIRADADTGEVSSSETFVGDVSDSPQLTFTGDSWALFDAGTGDVWVEDAADPIPTGAEPGARLQHAGPAADGVLIADAGGLIEVSRSTLASSRLTDDTVSGTPTAPVPLEGDMVVAWMGSESGTLWTSNDGTRTLDYGGATLDDETAPEFSTNGSRMILNETRSGWVWTVPDGKLLASSQAWDLDERVPQQIENVETQRVIDPKPPIAEPDTFGVRAGRDAVLPVLLNDHDSNEDVLSVVPSSIDGLPEDFGTVHTANNDQHVVVQVAETATGSASFTYQVTDGTSTDGLVSAPATVTLNVIPEDVNSPPVWCGVDGCLSEWPAPQIQAGGTVTTEVLGGWVDPEGDPVYLTDATNESGVGSVLTTPQGSVTYQHPDPNDPEARSITLDVTVSDTRGATATKPLAIGVSPNPQLALEPIAVTGVTGQAVMIDLHPHVTGAAGTPRLTAATLLDESQGETSLNGQSLSFTMTGETPGSIPIQVTVADDANEVTGIVRVTLTDPAEATISTVPLTAFVRPSEDSTIDVLPAVTNPANLVLLVSDLELEPEADATLSVDVIGQQHLRVAGSTEDGEPGTLGRGTYTVSDGSGDARRSATGEITFVLLPSADSTPPIAVDDRVTVRAGAQIDIPVLDNDTAPAGTQIAIDPSTVANDHEAGLAFATNRYLRYLAPEEPGTYTLSYTIFRLGFPSTTDTARVHITVQSDDENSAPRPPTLEGRALSGSTVSIPFDSHLVDADGDVTMLDRVVSQPERGSARISPEGDALIYSGNPGAKGQDSFLYQVRDSLGESGVGEVRIGVLDEESDPSPITYSDYVQLQVGADSEAILYPAENDIDPGGSALELIDVRPNAIADSDEYRALEERLGGLDEDTGRVRLLAGTELGTSSYVYTVRNANGDTAMGLIVSKVVREPVPDYPVVRDTRLTTETLQQLPDGIDVLSDKVSWGTGDPSGLELSLWEEGTGFRSQAWNIAGDAPDEATIVPFEVSGETFLGTEVTSYGFLKIPGKDDVRLSLRAAYSELDVRENESEELDLERAIMVPTGEQLVVDADGVRASGIRSDASCEAVSDTAIRYNAGSGAPWHDSCVIPVKLESQSDFTYLSLAVSVIAEDPQPQLRQGSLSVSPGDTATYDLQQMVTWEGRQDRDRLTFSVNYQGDQFEVRQDGARVSVTATDTSKPGRHEPVTVTLTSHPDAEVGTLRLTVGPAPSTLPRGAAVTQQCSQAGGQTSCTIPVVGQSGEVNPLPGTPLKLRSVTSPANCEAVSFNVQNETTVRATWSSDAPGAADCTGTFVVEDAQGRQSTGDRAGQVILDLRGLPSNPTRLNWTAYDGDSVRLSAVSESSSYPAVTGYRVTGGGKQVNCPASGDCRVGGLENGKETEFSVTALNDVGESRGTTSTTAWAYRAPQAPSKVGDRSFVPVPNGQEGGRAKVSVNVTDGTTSKLIFSSRAGTIEKSVNGTGTVDVDLDVGSNRDPVEVTVTPVTRFQLPPERVGGGSSEGRALSIAGVHGVGAPIIDSFLLTPNLDEGQVTVRVDLSMNGSDVFRTGFVVGRDCSVDQGSSALEHTFDVPRNREVNVTFCATHSYQGQEFPARSHTESVTLRIPAPTNTVYEIGAAPESTGSTHRWTTVISHAQKSSPWLSLRYSIGPDGTKRSAIDQLLQPGAERGGEIYVHACDFANQCSSAPMQALAAPVLPIVEFGRATGETCTATPPAPVISPETARQAAVIDVSEDETQVTVSFPGWGLNPVTWTCVEPAPVPDPEPGEEPTP